MSELIQCKGIVLAEHPYGEFDKMLTVLTAENGKITVSAKGAKRTTGKFLACSQLFCYSAMQLYRGRSEIYNLNDAALISSFYPLREDLDRLIAASRIARLTLQVAQSEFEDEPLMRLLLNTLYFLSEGKREPALLECIFRIRLVADQGYFEERAYRENGSETAIRHILTAPMEKLFSFRVSDPVLAELRDVAEKSVARMLEA